MVKYPVYVFSHKRAEPNESSTTKYLMKNKIPYSIVVAKDEVPEYKKYHKNVVVGKKGQSPNMNSILDKHQNGDWVWMLDDDWGDVKNSTYRTAMETAEKYVNENVGQIGFRHSDLWASRLPPITHNAMLYNFSLVKVSPARYNKNNNFNQDLEFAIDNILSQDKINLKLNKFRIKQEHHFHQHDGGLMATTYEKGMPEGLTLKQQQRYKDKLTEFNSKEALKNLVKKHKLRGDVGELRTGTTGGKYIWFDFDKMVPKYKDWKKRVGL